MYDSKGKAILGGYSVLVTYPTERIGRIFFDPDGVMVLFSCGSIEFYDRDFCRKHLVMLYDGYPSYHPKPLRT
jgi:hypothetical protein